MAYEQAKGWFTSVQGIPVTKHEVPASCHYSGWTAGRPHGIMVHETAGCTADIHDVLVARGISAHFCVSRSGDIYQYVSALDSAAHAYDANNAFFGIEHESSGRGGSCKPTLNQRNASAALSAALVEFTKRRYDVDIPARHVPGCDLDKHGFKAHRDGAYAADGSIHHCDWNPNVHIDDPCEKWGWPTYLALVEKNGAPEPVVVAYRYKGVIYNRLRRLLKVLRGNLAKGKPAELHEVKVVRRVRDERD